MYPPSDGNLECLPPVPWMVSKWFLHFLSGAQRYCQFLRDGKNIQSGYEIS